MYESLRNFTFDRCAHADSGHLRRLFRNMIHRKSPGSPAGAMSSFVNPRYKIASLSASSHFDRASQLGYLESGDASKPVILCLHGIGSNATGFRYQLSGLSREFRVVSWDAPGYGSSTPFSAPEPSIADYGEQVIRLLDALEVATCHVIGSSLGALISAQVAALAPTRMLTLLLTAPHTGSGRTVSQREGELKARRDSMSGGLETYAQKRVPALVASDDPELLEMVTEITLKLDPSAYLQAAYSLAAGNMFEYTPAIQARTLVCVGSRDEVTPVGDHAELITKSLPNANLKLFEGCAHLLELEAPTLFNETVRDFIGSTARSDA